MERRCLLKMSECAPLSSLLLLLLLLGQSIQATCPPICSCTDRAADCSWRALTHLPDGLDPSIQSLNLSHNWLSDLDHQLSPYTHLRILDISYNSLDRLPVSLPRSLWEIHASNNDIRILEKGDTANQWNLRVLDLSVNHLKRVVFINNTLPRLRELNLSCNAFWTMPTNMPHNLDMVDLSHNTLVQILPGSLDRLSKLSRLYLHDNRFSEVEEGAFEQLHGLKLITLGDNIWDCEDQDRVRHLLDWVGRTSARVTGCPCHTFPICGGAQPFKKGGWHFAPYTISLHRTTNQGLNATHHTWESPQSSSSSEEDHTFRHGAPTTSTFDRLSTSESHIIKETPFTTGHLLATDTFFTTSGVLTSSTRRTTTLRTRSVKRASQGLGRNSSQRHSSWALYTISLNLLLLAM